MFLNNGEILNRINSILIVVFEPTTGFRSPISQGLFFFISQHLKHLLSKNQKSLKKRITIYILTLVIYILTLVTRLWHPPYIYLTQQVLIYITCIHMTFQTWPVHCNMYSFKHISIVEWWGDHTRLNKLCTWHASLNMWDCLIVVT